MCSLHIFDYRCVEFSYELSGNLVRYRQQNLKELAPFGIFAGLFRVSWLIYSDCTETFLRVGEQIRILCKLGPLMRGGEH